MIVVTPDGERTMNTYLGASATLCADHLDLDLIASAKVTFLEGYLFDRDDAKAAFRLAAETAHAAGRKVSLTLSDSFCVDRHRDDFLDLVHGGVDILFANEEEIMKLYGVDSFDAGVDAVRGSCEIAAVTRGREGSVVVTADELVVGRGPPGPQARRHHGRRRPLRRRLPVRLVAGSAAARVRPPRLHRRRRRDRPHRASPRHEPGADRLPPRLNAFRVG